VSVGLFSSFQSAAVFLCNYSALVGVWSIVINPSVCLCMCLSMCVSVCLSVHEHISVTAGPIFTKFVAQIPCCRGSVLLWRRNDTLCTSGFMDDVTFGRSGPCGDGWLAALRYLVSVNALFCSYVYL